MKTVVYGAGGTGGFYGGMLARAGEDVTLIARGAHLRAIQKVGLTVDSAKHGKFHVPKVRAVGSAKEAGPADIVLICVKSYDLEGVAKDLAPLLHDDTVVVPILNGVEAVGTVERAIGRGRVLGGVAYIEANITGPGAVRHGTANLDRIVFGEPGGGKTPRAERVRAALARGGFDVEATPDIDQALWNKFVFICGIGGIGALTRLPFGPCQSDRVLSRAVEDTTKEVMAVAAAHGVTLPPDALAKHMDRFRSLPGDGRTSLSKDLLGGRRLELEALNGAACRLGRAKGVATPLNDLIYAGLKPHVTGAA